MCLLLWRAVCYKFCKFSFFTGWHESYRSVLHAVECDDEGREKFLRHSQSAAELHWCWSQGKEFSICCQHSSHSTIRSVFWSINSLDHYQVPCGWVLFPSALRCGSVGLAVSLCPKMVRFASCRNQNVLQWFRQLLHCIFLPETARVGPRHCCYRIGPICFLAGRRKRRPEPRLVWFC